MRARLEKSCARCKKTTIDTYMWNIKALAKVAGHKSVPNRMDWVTKSLLEKIKKLPISQYKRFAMAGVKVLSAFGKKNSSWEAAMRDSTDRYGAIRDKQKRTDREAKNWPDGGYAALKKLADKLYEGVKQLELFHDRSLSGLWITFLNVSCFVIFYLAKMERLSI